MSYKLARYVKSIGESLSWNEGYEGVQEFPSFRWLKNNTYGVSRGNPILSAYAFSLRDDMRNVKYAEGRIIQNTTNTVARS